MYDKEIDLIDDFLCYKNHNVKLYLLQTSEVILLKILIFLFITSAWNSA